MNAEIVLLWIVETGRFLVTLAGNWFIQSTCILTLGLTAAWSLRRHGAALQSAVLRATLACVIFCPIAVAGMSALGVTGFRLVLPEAGYEAGFRPSTIAGGILVSSERRHATEDGQSRTVDLKQEGGGHSGKSGRIAGLPRGGRDGDADEVTAAPSDVIAPDPVAGGSHPQVNPAPEISHSWRTAWAWLYAVGGATWIVVSGLLLIRLLIANLLIRLARRQSSPADPQLLASCGPIAVAIGVRMPTVVVSSKVRSPCLVGWWQPAILLPARVELPVREVLVHELAHLKRGDCLSQFAGRLVAAVLWFQPLMWRLVRRIEQSADDVCDDFALALGCSPEVYSRRLVEIAERFQPHWSETVAAAGIVSFRSSLGLRVERILDGTRRLSLSVTPLTLLAVVAMSAASVLAAGLVGVADRAARDDIAFTVADNAGPLASQVAAVVSAEFASDRGGEHPDTPAEPGAIEYSGTVSDADGHPLENAQVYVRFNPDDREVEPKASTGADGRFQFIITKTDSDAARHDEPWRYILVLASLDGFGPAVIFAGLPSATTNLTLKLPRDDPPIQGQIVTAAGQPVPGVKISVQSVVGAAARNGDPMPFDAPQGRYSNWGIPWPSSFSPSATTDEAGRFEIRGIGRGRLVQLSMAAPTIENLILEVVTRPPDLAAAGDAAVVPARADLAERRPPRLRYGATFVHIAAPSRPIVGVVRDADTGRPLPGARVRGTTTDERGEFRLTGLPRSRHELRAESPANDSYLTGRVICSTSDEGTDPVRVEIGLRRGILVTGKLVDQAGEPATGFVRYFPLLANPNAIKLAESLSDTATGQPRVYDYPTSRAETDGSFRIPVIPGPGLLLVVAHNEARRETTLPLKLRFADRRKSLLDVNDSQLFATSPLPQLMSEYHAYQFLDLPADAETHTVELAIDTGHAIRGRVVDNSGEPLSDVIAFGTTQSRLLDGGEFTARGLAQDHQRILYFYRPRSILAGFYRATGNEQLPVNVTLEPCGSVSGQLVDREGKPLAKVRMSLLYVEADGVPRIVFPDGRRIPVADELERLRKIGRPFHDEESARPETTDDEGRFTLTGLVPRLQFRLVAWHDSSKEQVIAETSVGPGRTHDLGTIELH